MSIGGVVIQFKADADKARRDVDKLSKSIDKVGDEARDSGRKFSTMAKVGIGAAITGIGLGVGALIKFGKAAADDYREAQALIDVLEKVPGVTQAMIDKNADWIASMELVTNIADKDLRESIGKLTVATQDLGKAQELTALAADIAAARQMSLSDATSLLEKAVGGNTMMLKRNMPWLDANKDGTITLKEAVKGLGDAYGGAAEKAANRDPWKKLEVIWGNIQEALGQALLPTLIEMGDWFKDRKNIKKIQEWVDKIGEWARMVGEEFRDKIVEFIDYLRSDEGQRSMQQFAGALQSIANGFAAIAGAVRPLITLLDKLPNWLLDGPGDILDRILAGPGGAFRDNPRPTPKVSVSKDQERALTEGRSGGKTVNVTINNGKQEKSVDSAALAIRLARTVGF